MKPFQTILAATDFSEAAEHAVEQAFALAAAQGAKVHLLHAYHVPAFPDGVTVGVDLAGPLEAAAIKALGRQTERYRTRPEFGGVILEMGDAREVIVHHAQTLPADLIVMSSRSKSGLERWLLGSVAERVVRSAPCPVLVVPPPQRPMHVSDRPERLKRSAGPSAVE